MRTRTLRCLSCGGRTRLDHGQTEALCLHCGQPVKLSQAILQEQESARRFPHRTPLRLGMKAQFEGKEFEAAGRQVMREVHSEGVSTWEEWVLIADDGDLVYLEFDEGKWKCSRPFVPDMPLSPEFLQNCGEGAILRIDGKNGIVQSRGSYQVVHAEGEFPFVVVPERMLGYIDVTHLSSFFSIEWTEDAIEYYRGRYLDERQIYTMFGLRDLVTQLDRVESGRRSRRIFGGICLGLSVLVLGVWAYSFASGKPATKGFGAVDLSQVGPEGVRFGPIPLKSVNRVHRLEIHGSMRETSVWVQAILEDDKEQELIATERDMWDESGHDSDGYWHESDLSGSSYFVLKQPGNYYVRLYAEKDTTQPVMANLSFRLKEEALYPTYLGVFGFSTLVIGFLFLVSGSSSTTQSSSSDDD